MTEFDEQGRPEPPPAGDETETLLGFLDFQRATLAWKSGELDSADLKATIGTSTMTLGGMLKHMAWVEDYWFSRRLHGRDPAPPWESVAWEADPDWEWNSAAEDSPEELLELWQEAVERSRSVAKPAMDPGPHDRGIRQAQRSCRPHSRVD
jgi:uncharacterized damage-inducible protein DinB